MAKLMWWLLIPFAMLAAVIVSTIRGYRRFQREYPNGIHATCPPGDCWCDYGP